VLHDAWFERWNPYRWQAPRPRAVSYSHTYTETILDDHDADEFADKSVAVSDKTGFPFRVAIRLITLATIAGNTTRLLPLFTVASCIV
jgi:hypothetical protein